MLVFRGVPSLTLTLRPICVVNIFPIEMGKMVPYHVFCEFSRVKNLQLSMPETTVCFFQVLQVEDQARRCAAEALEAERQKQVPDALTWEKT